MYKPALLSGCILAMLAVIFGAFGAHYLKSIFTPELLSSFETGVRYQFYHSFALLFVGLYAKDHSSKLIRTIFLFFLIGVLLFSGSIYLLCAFKSANIIGLSGLGILTPIGGLCFIIAWGLLIVNLIMKKE
jgi:uncharacterized membrane protein YgdD (TMEM256/DUF423 family)